MAMKSKNKACGPSMRSSLMMMKMNFMIKIVNSALLIADIAGRASMISSSKLLKSQLLLKMMNLSLLFCDMTVVF